MEITLDFLDNELKGIKRQQREMEDKVQHARGAVDILKQLIDYSVKPNPTEGTLTEALAGTDLAVPEEPPESEEEEENASEPDN